MDVVYAVERFPWHGLFGTHERHRRQIHPTKEVVHLLMNPTAKHPVCAGEPSKGCREVGLDSVDVFSRSSEQMDVFSPKPFSWRPTSKPVALCSY